MMKSQVNKEPSSSQKIQILLKKQVKDIDWEHKRLFAVHCYYFLKNLGVAAYLQRAAEMTGVSDSFIRKWRDKFKAQGEISVYTKWGHNSKYITLFDYEDKMLQAKKWIREVSNQKGVKAMTVEMFAKYCTDLMSDIVVNSKSNKEVSVETARRWLHQLGFEYSSVKTGYNDGHERPQVKEYREIYLASILNYQNQGYLFDDKSQLIDIYQDISFKSRIAHGGFLKEGVDQPVIIVYHDESIYNVNDDQRSFWQDGETPSMKSKGKGLGIMVSDFLTEEGFLDENEEMGLRVCLEYNKDGHWTHQGMKEQLTLAIKVFEKRYPGHVCF
jgi:transposase